jgi:hypothetical protein
LIDLLNCFDVIANLGSAASGAARRWIRAEWQLQLAGNDLDARLAHFGSRAFARAVRAGSRRMFPSLPQIDFPPPV